LEYRRLEALIGYCETVKCRKAALLSYFDEESEPCGNCDNCINPPIVEDYSAQARMVLEAVEQTGQFFGASHIIDLVRGAETAKILEKKHHNLMAFGAGKSHAKSFFQMLVRQLVSSGILKVNLEKYGAIQLTRKAAAIVAGTDLFYGRLDAETDTAPAPKKASDSSRFKGYNASLFQALKAARLNIAQEKDVPAYVIFSDSTLKEMALRQPVTKDDFASINGIGKQKLTEYFERFTTVIQGWQQTES
jgi:ATP-dependent DNA helicase RecQ